jgi:hypothetical protein
MNRAKIGVVCGVDDGAPAILTEYMLAGLPVLANVNLRCGLQYITPKTGATATEDKFHLGLRDLIGRASGCLRERSSYPTGRGLRRQTAGRNEQRGSRPKLGLLFPEQKGTADALAMIKGGGARR